MKTLKISRGFDLYVAEQPDLRCIDLDLPATLGCCAGDIPHIRPKLLVKEGQQVKTGEVVFTDKRDTTIQYVSPGTGLVAKIVYGPRRYLMAVVISAQCEDEYVEHDPLSLDSIAGMSRQELVMHLKKGGMWQGLRQFPALDFADPDYKPPMIIVAMDGNDLFSPRPDIILKDNIDAFEAGMAVLRKLSHGVVVVCRESSLEGLRELDSLVANQVTHTAPDIYPAWHPGAVLYQIKERQEENSAWCIRLDHLVLIGRFVLSGRYPVEKIVTVTSSGERLPHMRVRQGMPLSALAGIIPGNSIVTTGRFNGRILENDAHIGFFENTVNIIDAGSEEQMFGFVRPGFDKPSVSATFLSSLFRRSAKMDCTLHGEERACINCSYCERICPNGLMPSFIMKALHAGELEDALALGLMDCCRCGLCSFACPSKIELTSTLSDAMDAYYKDKQ
ncbi:4Fe-4S dicluster domain-containing protein [uncultured Desulfobacter sp.]|uniref:4Fe-4S dicluster domain-containing protein n=1 Tax=uncultured Desulfobacter sp. TaxID=240139 RepID=UPI002AAB6416|nr:4Fe-4S dicluster domain-containing protein [uncultured Desulfobacter sp.]